jgi:hypothetical protein
MFRYNLRTLLIVLALGPPLLAGAWWGWERYVESQRRQLLREILRSVADDMGHGVQYIPATEVPMRETREGDLDEPVIGYPFGVNDPRYPGGFKIDRPLNHEAN